MSIKAFLFDVDGVLYDSMPEHATSWVAAFKEQKVLLSPKFVYFCEGMPEPKAVVKLADMAGVALSKRQREGIVKRKRELFDRYRKPKLIKGAKRLLLFLKKKKIEVCLVTGSYQPETIKRVAEDFGISRRRIVTGKDVARGKPYPDPYLVALKKTGVSAGEAIVIENSPLGLLSAKAAGLPSVALTTGLLPAKELKKYQPEWIFKDCDELLTTLAKGRGKLRLVL